MKKEAITMPLMKYFFVLVTLLFLFLERAYLVYQTIDKTKLSKTNFPKQNPVNISES